MWYIDNNKYLCVADKEALQHYLESEKISRTKFNQPVKVIGSQPTALVELFEGMKNFNSDVIIENKYVYTARRMFKGCSKFNQPVKFPKLITSYNETFMNCISFNQSIDDMFLNIKGHSYMANKMFYGCKSFNQPFNFKKIIKNTIILTSMFEKCISIDEKSVRNAIKIIIDPTLENYINFNCPRYIDRIFCKTNFRFKNDIIINKNFTTIFGSFKYFYDYDQDSIDFYILVYSKGLGIKLATNSNKAKITVCEKVYNFKELKNIRFGMIPSKYSPKENMFYINMNREDFAKKLLYSNLK